MESRGSSTLFAMLIGPTKILDTHAEAFAAYYARLIVTAVDERWLAAALQATTGYGTSIIGCDAEVGVEQHLPPSATPDGRPGAAVLIFARSLDRLAKATGNRVSQCVLTCPTTACYNGLPNAAETIPLGKYVRYFGDGWEERGARSEGKYPFLPRSPIPDPRHSAVFR